MCYIFPGIAKHDNEGRVITAEFEDFYLVTSCELFYMCMPPFLGVL